MLLAAGFEPRGFVAPAYAYTPPLRAHLSTHFDWWATLLPLLGSARAHTSALGFGTTGALPRALSPALVRAGAPTRARVLRLDLHPADFDHPRHVLALQRVLARARDRPPLTYDDLLFRRRAG